MKRKILIIESDRDISEIVTYILEDNGYQVVCNNAFSTDQIRIAKPDLILLDEWILKEGSDMLCKKIKEIEDMKHIPVIIFSTSVKIKEIAADCKAEGHVNKPFDVDDLLNEVKRCCLPGSALLN